MTKPITAKVIQRFSAPAEKVFDAWLDTKLIGQWMFGKNLRDEEIVSIKTDGRVGGKFSFVVKRQDLVLDHFGEYLEISRPKRLVFTWGVDSAPNDSSRVVIEIKPLAKGCELTLTHELHPNWADFKERTEAGWTKMLGVLNQQLMG